MAGRNVFAAVRSYLQPGAGLEDDCFWPLFAKNAKNRTVFRGSGKGRSRRNLRLPVACLHEMCVGIAGRESFVQVHSARFAKGCAASSQRLRNRARPRTTATVTYS